VSHSSGSAFIAGMSTDMFSYRLLCRRSKTIHICIFILLILTTFVLWLPTGLTTLMFSVSSVRGNLSPIHDLTSWTRLTTWPLNRPTPLLPVVSLILIIFMTQVAMPNSCCSSSLSFVTLCVDPTASEIPGIMSDCWTVISSGSDSSVILLPLVCGGCVASVWVRVCVCVWVCALARKCVCVWCRLLHVGCALGCVWLWDRVIRRFWWVGVVWGCIVVGAVRVVACGCVWLCVPAPARGLRAGVCVASVWVRVCVCVWVYVLARKCVFVFVCVCVGEETYVCGTWSMGDLDLLCISRMECP
jgi:hypothetical protein